MKPLLFLVFIIAFLSCSVFAQNLVLGEKFVVSSDNQRVTIKHIDYITNILYNVGNCQRTDTFITSLNFDRYLYWESQGYSTVGASGCFKPVVFQTFYLYDTDKLTKMTTDVQNIEKGVMTLEFTKHDAQNRPLLGLYTAHLEDTFGTGKKPSSSGTSGGIVDLIWKLRLAFQYKDLTGDYQNFLAVALADSNVDKPQTLLEKLFSTFYVTPLPDFPKNYQGVVKIYVNPSTLRREKIETIDPGVTRTLTIRRNQDQQVTEHALVDVDNTNGRVIGYFDMVYDIDQNGVYRGAWDSSGVYLRYVYDDEGSLVGVYDGSTNLLRIVYY